MWTTVSFRHCLFSPTERAPGSHCARGLVRITAGSEVYWWKKHVFPGPGIEPRLISCPSRILASIQPITNNTELLLASLKTDISHKLKGCSITCQADPEGRYKLEICPYSNPGLKAGGQWATRSGHFTPRKRPRTHCTGGWMGPRAGLDGSGRSPPLAFEPRTLQPDASRYTSYTIPFGIFTVLLC